MYTRKLVKAGPSSHTVALPKDWIFKNNLKKGDVVFVSAVSDSQLLLSAKEHVEAQVVAKEKLIEIDNKEMGAIQREITSAYLNNYSLITLSGSSVAEKAKEIRNIVHNFVALEITEQNSKKICAKDFLNLNEISVDKSIKRIDMIIRTMFDDFSGSGESLQSSIELRDEDVNRLYFLLVRLLKSAVVDKKIAGQLELDSGAVLMYWQIVHDLEGIADNIKQAHSLVVNNSKLVPGRVFDLYKSVQNLYVDAVKAHYQRDKCSAELVAKAGLDFVEKLKSFSSRGKNFIAVFVQNADAINSHIMNIARQVIDSE